MTVIGDELSRQRGLPRDLPAHVRVVGQHGGEWVVTDADQFGTPWTISASDLANAYGGTSDPVEVDEQTLRAPGADALRAAAEGYRSENVTVSDAPREGSAPSPEQVFAAAARDEA